METKYNHKYKGHIKKQHVYINISTHLLHFGVAGGKNIYRSSKYKNNQKQLTKSWKLMVGEKNP